MTGLHYLKNITENNEKLNKFPPRLETRQRWMESKHQFQSSEIIVFARLVCAGGEEGRVQAETGRAGEIRQIMGINRRMAAGRPGKTGMEQPAQEGSESKLQICKGDFYSRAADLK